MLEAENGENETMVGRGAAAEEKKEKKNGQVRRNSSYVFVGTLCGSVPGPNWLPGLLRPG